MTTGNPDWLDLTQENPLDPELPVCDAHQHFFTRSDSRYSPEDFRQDIQGGHRVVSSVYIECMSAYRKEGPEEMKPVGETEFVQTIAAASASDINTRPRLAAGIVGFADLTLGKGVEPVLEAHIRAGKGYFWGVRHSSYWDPNPAIASRRKSPRGLLLDTGFREAFPLLYKYGLSYDAGVYFHQLSELVDLARAFPQVPMILAHTGGPVHTGPYAGKGREVMEQWKSGIAALAACPNVFINLGGLGLPHCGFGWHEQNKPPGSMELAEKMSPYFLWCIERFGVERCMFESNFPVDRVFYSYTVLWNAFKQICRGFSGAERAALLHDTAARAYRIDSAAG